MKIENTIRIMKEIHKEKVIIVKIGTFCRCYGKDAEIVSYLFDYILKKSSATYECGFPITSITKIMLKLESMQIDYIVVNKSENYEVDSEEEYRKENKYVEIYSKAHKYINRKNRINEIYKYFIDNINDDSIKEKIIAVEGILYEI